MNEGHPSIEESKPNKLRWIFIGAGLLFIVAGFALQQTAPEPEKREAQGETALTLRATEVRAQSFRRVAEVAGLLEARRTIELFAEGEGRIVEVGAEELDTVVAGQMLLRIESLVPELEVARAEATLARALSQDRLAKASLNRQNKLAGSSVASEAARDEAINAESVARAAVNEARAALKQAKDRLDKVVLDAPFAGQLRVFSAEAGEYVRVGERVGELLEVDRLRITIALSDREVVSVRTGAVAGVVASARPGERFEGRVERIGGAIDPTSRKFPVQIEVPNAQGRLMPGMVATVELPLGESVEMLAIPREAVLSEFGIPFVYAIERDTSQEREVYRARKRRVEIRDIAFRPVEVEVVKGLESGEKIATSSLRQLRDGVQVSPRMTTGNAGVSEVVSRIEGDESLPTHTLREGDGG